MARDDAIREQAIGWAVRAGDPGFDDWENFTAWLESDPAHAAAYDRVSALLADAAEQMPPAQEAVNDDEPAVGHTRRRWLGGMVAAAVALVAGVGIWQMRGDSYAIETAPGEHRMIALGSDGKIELAGGTRIVLDRDDPHLASLERGQALFTIRHDPARPFRVNVGEDELVDIGTIFDVKHTAGQITLAVAEGAVAFNPKQQNVQVNPGQMLTSAKGSDAYILADVATAQVGEWRDGRLTFQNQPLSEIASDLTNATGLRFEVAPGAGTRRVSGSLLVDPVRADPRSAGALLGTNVSPADDGWIIGGR